MWSIRARSRREADIVKTTTRTRALLIGATAGMLALTGCGGAASDSGGQDRTYVYAIDDDPRGMNAQLVGAPATSMFSAQMLEPLIFLSSDYTMSPALAEEWELSPDGTALELTLRDGVTWHDGEPFTAEDVKFNFEEIVPLSSFGAAIDSRLESVEITDDDSVVLHMKEPYGPLLEVVSAQYMIPKHIYEGTDYATNEANMAPIGTGPLMFESYSSGEDVVLAKNPDYWGGDVQVDRVVFPIMKDATNRTEALFAGEIDQTVISSAQLPRIEEDPAVELLDGFAYPQTISLLFDAGEGPLESPAVRRAVFAAIDREVIGEKILKGFGTPTNGFFPESLGWALSPDVDFARDFPHDVDAINAELDAAGFERDADGMRFTLDIRYLAERTDTSGIAELAKSMLQEVGIELNLVGSTAAVFIEKVFTESDFDLALQASTVGADPSVGIARWYTCNEEKASAANPSRICDPEIDDAAADALNTTDQAQRAEAFTALQNRAAELMYHAPIAWFNGQFPSYNTSRWAGHDEPRPASNRMPWTTMTYQG